MGPSGCMLCLGMYGTVAGPILLGLGSAPAAPSPELWPNYRWGQSTDMAMARQEKGAPAVLANQD